MTRLSVLSAIIADHVFRKRACWLIFRGRQIRYLDVRKATLNCNLAQMLKNCVLNASPEDSAAQQESIDCK